MINRDDFVLNLFLDYCKKVTESGWCALFTHLKSLFESLESLTMNLGNHLKPIHPKNKMFIFLGGTEQTEKTTTTLAKTISQLKTIKTLDLNYCNDDKH